MIRETEKTNVRAIKIVYGGVLTALGVLLPQAFHVFGQNSGMTFLPIHIPILLAGILLGPVYGGVVGVLVPILSSILTGMPPVPKLYFMLVELVVYGVVTGLLVRKCNIYITLVSAMAAGRILYGAALAVGVGLFHIHAPFANQAAFIGGILTGIPGIMIQLVILPILYGALRRGGFTFER